MEKPKGKFLVIAELTENSAYSGAKDKGYRYFVHAHDDKIAGETGRGTFCTSIEQAHNRIAADKKIMGNRFDASGLIDWGKATPREYAIFPVTFGDEVK